jgi:hypothetical protein
MAASSSSSHRPVLPCLAVQCSCCKPNTTFISAAEKKPVAHCLPELLNVKATVCPTPLGWILVRESASGSTYLLDPQSRQDDKIPLPPLTGIDDDVLMDCNCLLSDQPTAQAAAGCVVLLVEPQDTVYHHIGAGAGGEWTRHEYDIGIQSDKYGFTEKIHIVPIAACRGKFYFKSFFTEISVLEFCGPAGPPRFSSIRLDGGGPGDWGRVPRFLAGIRRGALHGPPEDNLGIPVVACIIVVVVVAIAIAGGCLQDGFLRAEMVPSC